jgi:hypothetical protein
MPHDILPWWVYLDMCLRILEMMILSDPPIHSHLVADRLNQWNALFPMMQLIFCEPCRIGNCGRADDHKLPSP